MRNPDIRLTAVSTFEARVLGNATSEPQALSALNDGMTGAKYEHSMNDLVNAGLLLRRRISAKRVGYVITPAGAELATYLERLDAARGAR